MTKNDDLKMNLEDCCQEVCGCPDCDEPDCADSIAQSQETDNQDQLGQDSKTKQANNGQTEQARDNQSEQDDQEPQMSEEQLAAIKAFNDHMQSLNDQIIQAQEQAQRERAKAEALAQRLVNLQAEFDNFRKRNAKSVNSAQAEGRYEVIIEVIKILDVIEHALSMIKDQVTASGVQMIYRQIQDVLKNFEVEEIEALGQEFDPNLHSAVESVKTEDANSGAVVEVIQKGYRLGEKILRYASVKVAE
ncbi:MAG TPA: nucleotide exchange factor GrpE [Clostridiales bacterium]|jgi:molecular chaperone GrpE|nr:nucleotide exchange factor GrpE [Clostridiales bacterium]